MSSTIDFYFDYSSPYGYLASERIEAIAKRLNYTIIWHPILLGAVFRVTGQAPLIDVPLKGDYARHDFARSAREYQIAFRQPDNFPIASVAAARATLWLREQVGSPSQLKTPDFIRSLYRAYFVKGLDITNTTVLANEASLLDIDPDSLITATADQTVKNLLRIEVEKAIEQGVFGSPTMIIDGELFWGHDRLEQMERWVAQGKW